MDSRLTTFQREVLEGFFAREQRFYLTGGAALAGFHLGHRTTEDLDLFTGSEVLDDGEEALRATATSIGATVERVRVATTYRRWHVRRDADVVVVDLAFDPTAQGSSDKERIGQVRVDPAEEILANKLTTILSRAETRDLVDAMFLLRQGHSLEKALELAQRKDASASAGTLAWLLGDLRIGDDARLPADVSVPQLRAFVEELRERLARLAFPSV